jgi:hypothetical protein
MPTYQDFPVNISDLSGVILDKLAGMYSVEVVRQGKGAILRVWLDQHCDRANATKDD